MTNFSIAPLQMVTINWHGYLLLIFNFTCIVLWNWWRFHFMYINFFLIGVTIMALGIIGEYTGRIYKQIQQRTHYIIRKICRGHGATKMNRPIRCICL